MAAGLLAITVVGTGCVNLNAEPEPVLHVEQPDASRQPIFDRSFGPVHQSFCGDDRAEEEICPDGYRSWTAAGGGRYFKVSELWRSVEVYDASTLALQREIPLGEPRGVTYYRAELFVVDRRDNAIEVFDPATGGLKRRLPLPTIQALGAFEPFGVDAAWNELWITLSGGHDEDGAVSGNAGGAILVLNAQTGGTKGAMWHLPRYNCTKDPLSIVSGTEFAACRDGDRADLAGVLQCEDQQTGFCDPGHLTGYELDWAERGLGGSWEWRDIATVPERNAVIAQCRVINRGALFQPTPTDEPPVSELLTSGGCADGGDQGGIDAVWGMNWLLTASSNGLREYGLNPAEPLVGSLRRSGWSNCGVWCDVVYQNRDARIDWSGPLTKQDWLRGTKCVDYVVTDADIYVASDSNARYFEPARGFQKIEMTVDGGWRQEKLTNPGQFCQDLTQVPSGTHTVRLKAWINNGSKTVTVTNDSANFDRDPPRPTVTAPDIATGTVQLSGGSSDDHSHARGWRPQLLRGSWQSICDQENTDPAATAPTYACAWNTTTVPDGSYAFRVEGTDYASDGGNPGYTAQGSMIVDNTQPTLAVSGELKEREDQQLIWDDESPQLHVDANDAASGVRSIEVLVDGLRKDFRERSCVGGSCGPLVFDYTLAPADYSEGNHPVQVTVTDHAGHTRSASWTVNIKRTPPDTVDEGATDITDEPGSPPDPAEASNPDVPQDDSDLDGSNSISAAQALQCPAADEFVVTSVIDFAPTLPADLGNGLLPSAPTLGFPTAELAVADFLNTSVMLPKIPPAIFAPAVQTPDYALFVARVAGNIEASIEVAKFPNGGWVGSYFSACSMFVDDYLGVTR